MDAWSDDLNTSGVFEELHRLKKAQNFGALRSAANLLGLLTPELDAWDWRKFEDRKGVVFVVGDAKWQASSALAIALGERWQRMREDRDFTSADVLKKKISEAGAELRADKHGVVVNIEGEFDPAKLEALK